MRNKQRSTHPRWGVALQVWGERFLGFYVWCGYVRDLRVYEIPKYYICGGGRLLARFAGTRTS